LLVKTHPLKANPLFGELPLELARNIESVNPWWTDGEPLDPPRYRRWPFDRMLRLLKSGMTPAIVLRGPRRVGKTVILRQAIQALLGEGVSPGRILYAPFDELPTFRGIKEPVLAVARWFEQTKLKASFNQMANEGHPAYLFLDEVQNLDAWAPQIKNLMDNHGVRALVTGSSSLRIEAGRDSLAGRVTTPAFVSASPANPTWATIAWNGLPPRIFGPRPWCAVRKMKKSAASRSKPSQRGAVTP
jgi:hypothetical protein